MDILPEARNSKYETWKMMAERENRVNAQEKDFLTATAPQSDKIGGYG